MHDNQDWLYSILFDRTVLKDSKAKHIYDIVLHLLQLLMSNQSGARFGIDRRNNRRISVDSNQGQLVPNIFQLSSGESSLLNLVSCQYCESSTGPEPRLLKPTTCAESLS